MNSSESEDDFTYDIFLSYNNKDEDGARLISEMYKAAGIRAYFAPSSLSSEIGRKEWEKLILNAIEKSRYLGAYCTKDALLSSWVQREIEHFVDCRGVDDSLIFVISSPNLSEEELTKIVQTNPILNERLRPRNITEALQAIVKRRITIISESLKSVKDELDQTKKLARQAFEHYRHARLWKLFSDGGRDLHVFTCGREMSEDRVRGAGGRTNIDKWDYQAAIDITHHFARHYRDVGVQIEQPVSKTRIDERTVHFDTTEFSSRLTDRNCVIIGSPGISDFAEIALARLLNVKPYAPRTPLKAGFKIVKFGQRFSTFYEEPSEAKSEGVYLMTDPGVNSYVIDSGRAYGVMVFADNPFSRPPMRNKILILSGYSGVATRAMSLLLTNEDQWCIDEFYKLDQKLAAMPGPVVAVIEVRFRYQTDSDRVGDHRIIDESPGSIRFVEAVSI